LYLGEPDVTLDPDILSLELEGIAHQHGDDDEKALFYGGEAAGRIEEIPTVEELTMGIMKEAEEIISSLPRLVESQ